MQDTFKDPVCGADVAAGESAVTLDYKGTTYYFCCPGCRRSFEKQPEKYLVQAASAHTHACC